MTLSFAELDEILEEGNRVAREAGHLLLTGLKGPKKISYKGVVDLVTDYDTRAEDLIRETLTRRFPEFGFFAEESADIANHEKETSWVVDPLDGTTNFAHGHPLFAVSIGLRERGQACCAGTIFIPCLNACYSARRGGGAFRNDQPISVSEVGDLHAALVATGFPYDRRDSEDDNTREHRAFIKHTQGVRRCGAAAVDLAFVAEGVLDGFWEPKLAPWDIAAGTVLVREAGGMVTDYGGEDIDIDKGWIVASNGRLHTEMLRVISSAPRIIGG